ncbi:MAG TPA: hypothetical protein VGV69_08055, partial [Solirubrobacterales bacterium]|nr:hypothetical protein [Solirubrobacterales bacterium]
RARESGITVYELPPGQAICPYHYNPTLRHPEGSERLEPWDTVFFPKGPEGAHGIRNETEKTARVLMFSTVVLPTATVYPDSDKVGVWTGNSEADVIVRRESKVDYGEGEV